MSKYYGVGENDQFWSIGRYSKFLFFVQIRAIWIPYECKYFSVDFVTTTPAYGGDWDIY